MKKLISNLKLPVIAAPMAGGINNPTMVAAVIKFGGLDLRIVSPLILLMNFALYRSKRFPSLMRTSLYLRDLNFLTTKLS